MQPQRTHAEAAKEQARTDTGKMLEKTVADVVSNGQAVETKFGNSTSYLTARIVKKAETEPKA